MNFVAVQHSITDEIVYINLNFVYSFIYYKDDDVTMIRSADGVVNAKGNIVGELKKYIQSTNGHCGVAMAK